MVHGPGPRKRSTTVLEEQHTLIVFLTSKVVLHLFYLLLRTQHLSCFALDAIESLNVVGCGRKVLETIVQSSVLLWALAM